MALGLSRADAFLMRVPIDGSISQFSYRPQDRATLSRVVLRLGCTTELHTCTALAVRFTTEGGGISRVVKPANGTLTSSSGILRSRKPSGGISALVVATVVRSQ